MRSLSHRTSLDLTTPQEAGTAQRRASWYMPGLSDGFGDRLLMFDNRSTAGMELLRFRPELGNWRDFEMALRRRVEQLADFNHAAFARVRSVERLADGGDLALVSDHIEGCRLSDLLSDARGSQLALALLRQLIPPLATLHRRGAGLAHGALTAERIIVTPEGRLVIVEHALGAALETLRMPAERLRSEFGVIVPPGGGSAHDARADVMQLGYLALTLVLGRRVDIGRDTERLVALAAPHSDFGRWLERALQVGGSGFESAIDAQRALESYRIRTIPPAARFAQPRVEPARVSKATVARAVSPPASSVATRPQAQVATPHFEPSPAAIADFSERERDRPASPDPGSSAWQWSDSIPGPSTRSGGAPAAFPRSARRIIVGLAVLAIAEGLVIAALLFPGLLSVP